jgi:hypothetical protein
LYKHQSAAKEVIEKAEIDLRQFVQERRDIYSKTVALNLKEQITLQKKTKAILATTISLNMSPTKRLG